MLPNESDSAIVVSSHCPLAADRQQQMAAMIAAGRKARLCGVMIRTKEHRTQKDGILHPRLDVTHADWRRTNCRGPLLWPAADGVADWIIASEGRQSTP